MRCLHCNKKLSLLKLAKGDSFCSPEHFDAHQLKLSKDAIERLMSIPAEDGPKAPLVVHRAEPEPAVAAGPAGGESVALARLTGFAPPPLPAAETFQPPPYAPFAMPEMAPWQQNPPFPVLNELETGQAVEGAGEVAFPVRAAVESAGMLNLYLRLSLAETEPTDWTGDRPPVADREVTPEEFRLEAAQPPIGFMPAFSSLPVEAVPPVEVAEPVDEAPQIEEVALAEIAPSIEPEVPAEPVLVSSAEPEIVDEPVLVSPIEPEIVAEPVLVSSAEPEIVAEPVLVSPAEPEIVAEPVLVIPAEPEIVAEPVLLIPAEPEIVAEPVLVIPAEPEIVAETLLVIPAEPGIVAETLLMSPAEPETVAEPVLVMAIEPEGIAEPVSIMSIELETPAESAPAESVTPASVEAKPPLPFVMAPSFLARTGAPILLHNAASAVHNDLSLAPLLDKGSLPRLDSCDAIPNSTRVAGNTVFHLQDSPERWIKGAADLPIDPAFILPDAKEQASNKPWLPSDREIVNVRPALDTTLAPARSVDFDLPAPASLLVRPVAWGLGEVDPQTLLGAAPIDTVSLFLGVLETRPLGQEPLFVDPPAFAMKYGWLAILAPFPAEEPLPAAWRDRTAYFSLPDPVAAGLKPPMSALEEFPYAPGCTKIDAIEKAKLPAPYVQKDYYRPTEWPETDSFAAPFPAEPGLGFSGTNMLPQAARVPKGSLKRGKGDPVLKWEARHPAAKPNPPAKFLPVRDAAILPAARNWPRLVPVPR